MGYYIKLDEISLSQYKEKLRSAYLPPSRKLLLEGIDAYFGQLQNVGYSNLLQLQKSLKKKGEIEETSQATGIPESYLTILLREINSIHPKPNKLADFNLLSEERLSKLEGIGIKTTLQLFPKVLTHEKREALSEETGISKEDVLQLTKLTDLSRIKWVGVTFAKMLYQLGYDTVKKASKADPVRLHQEINQFNQEKKYYRGAIGLNDIKIFVRAAGEVPLVIMY